MLKRLTLSVGSVSPVPAAFRRLCVETCLGASVGIGAAQPPSGGCVLKLPVWVAAFSFQTQPPSGGCVLKHPKSVQVKQRDDPAAFRRLCVETCHTFDDNRRPFQPPSGGCVLKHTYCFTLKVRMFQPPSGGCVLKL